MKLYSLTTVWYLINTGDRGTFWSLQSQFVAYFYIFHISTCMRHDLKLSGSSTPLSFQIRTTRRLLLQSELNKFCSMISIYVSHIWETQVIFTSAFHRNHRNLLRVPPHHDSTENIPYSVVVLFVQHKAERMLYKSVECLFLFIFLHLSRLSEWIFSDKHCLNVKYRHVSVNNSLTTY